MVCRHRLSGSPWRDIDNLTDVEVPDEAGGDGAGPQIKPAVAAMDGADVGVGDALQKVERGGAVPCHSDRVVRGEELDGMGLQRVVSTPD